MSRAFAIHCSPRNSVARCPNFHSGNLFELDLALDIDFVGSLGVESQIVKLASIGLVRKLLSGLNSGCPLGGSNSVGRMPASQNDFQLQTKTIAFLLALSGDRVYRVSILSIGAILNSVLVVFTLLT